MNARDVRSLLDRISTLPVEKLSARDIYTLGTALKQSVEFLERVQILSKIEELSLSVPMENVAFYHLLLNEEASNKHRRDIPTEELEAYYHFLKTQYSTIEKKKKEYQKLLDKVDKLKEKNALELLASLNDTDKKLLSALANLTTITPKGVAKLELAGSKASIYTWYKELKNTKSLGILQNE
jgi:hypothetical protein